MLARHPRQGLLSASGALGTWAWADTLVQVKPRPECQYLLQLIPGQDVVAGPRLSCRRPSLGPRPCHLPLCDTGHLWKRSFTFPSQQERGFLPRCSPSRSCPKGSVHNKSLQTPAKKANLQPPGAPVPASASLLLGSWKAGR